MIALLAVIATMVIGTAVWSLLASYSQPEPAPQRKPRHPGRKPPTTVEGLHRHIEATEAELARALRRNDKALARGIQANLDHAPGAVMRMTRAIDRCYGTVLDGNDDQWA
jgi:hypothetical protein